MFEKCRFIVYPAYTQDILPKSIMKKSLNIVRNELQTRLPVVFSYTEHSEVLAELTDLYSFSESSKHRLANEKIDLEIKSNLNKDNLSLWTLKRDEVDPFTVCSAICRTRDYYFSHHTAMYLHDLFNQRPNHFYLTKEISSKSRPEGHASKIDLHAIVSAFLKPPRQTTNFHTYKTHKIFLLEKSGYEKIGVTQALQFIGKGQERFLFTDLERTFIDAIMAPQYAGGILTVINAFRKKDLNIKKLRKYYSVFNPFYPYWQSIGFVLSIYDTQKAAGWAHFFKDVEKVPFFLDKNAKRTWPISEEWNLYYPRGLIDGNDG